MNKIEMEKYYFPTKEIKAVRNKYLKSIIKFIDKHNLFLDKMLSQNEILQLQDYVKNKITNFLTENAEIFQEVSKAYKLESPVFLSDILLQSLCAHVYLCKRINNFDIFKSPNSILYFNNEYPPNIIEWQNNKNLTVLDICEFYNKLSNFLYNNY